MNYDENDGIISIFSDFQRAYKARLPFLRKSCYINEWEMYEIYNVYETLTGVGNTRNH